MVHIKKTVRNEAKAGTLQALLTAGPRCRCSDFLLVSGAHPRLGCQGCSISTIHSCPLMRRWCTFHHYLEVLQDSLSGKPIF